jgi:hypothetical protein
MYINDLLNCLNFSLRQGRYIAIWYIATVDGKSIHEITSAMIYDLNNVMADKLMLASYEVNFLVFLLSLA